MGAELKIFFRPTAVKGNVFPLTVIAATLSRMNLRLSDSRIRATCRELLATQRAITGRQLRETLRRRFGAVGKTERVFQIWREESATKVAPALMPRDAAELRRRLAAAEADAAENLARAVRAEYREQAHQDKWAMEVDQLRQEIRKLRGSTLESR